MAFYQVEIFGLIVLLINGWNSVTGTTSIIVLNKCNKTVWPGIYNLPNDLGISYAILESTGFELSQNASFTFEVLPGWKGRLWGRTGCNFKVKRNHSCTTGDCGSGEIGCDGYQATTPATHAEFSLNQFSSQDFYDVSLVDGFNLPMLVEPSGGVSGACASTGCTQDLNQICPTELRAAGACKSACFAFGTPEYCCKGVYNSATKCVPTNYSDFFKSACPTSFSYAYDDNNSTFTCTGANYTITFCPSSLVSHAHARVSNKNVIDRENHNSMGSNYVEVFGLMVLLIIGWNSVTGASFTVSVKSDVFSFGVLLLEIISGQKNNAFYESNGVDDLGSYAWKSFMNGIPLALLDPSVGELYTRNEVICCIHVGLLCVQYDPQSRPMMASVVTMLSSNTETLPIPQQPAFLATSCVVTSNRERDATKST